MFQLPCLVEYPNWSRICNSASQLIYNNICQGKSVCLSVIVHPSSVVVQPSPSLNSLSSADTKVCNPKSKFSYPNPKLATFFTNSLTACQLLGSQLSKCELSKSQNTKFITYFINSLSECQLFKSQNTKFITFFINSLSECQLFKSQIFQIFNIYQEMTVYFPNTCLQVSLKKFSNSLAVVSI